MTIDERQFIEMTKSEISGRYGSRKDPIVVLKAKLSNAENAREIESLMMKHSQIVFHETTTSIQHDALIEIERAHRLCSGQLQARTIDLLRAPGGQGGSDHIAALAADLIRAYNDWHVFLNRQSPQALSLVMWLVEGGSMASWGQEFVSLHTKRKLRDMAIETWRDIRGLTKKHVRVPPTARQQEVLSYIKRYNGMFGISPTLREIQREFGLASKTSAKQFLDELCKRGWIKRIPAMRNGVAVI